MVRFLRVPPSMRKHVLRTGSKDMAPGVGRSRHVARQEARGLLTFVREGREGTYYPMREQKRLKPRTCTLSYVNHVSG